MITGSRRITIGESKILRRTSNNCIGAAILRWAESLIGYTKFSYSCWDLTLLEVILETVSCAAINANNDIKMINSLQKFFLLDTLNMVLRINFSSKVELKSKLCRSSLSFVCSFVRSLASKPCQRKKVTRKLANYAGS